MENPSDSHREPIPFVSHAAGTSAEARRVDAQRSPAALRLPSWIWLWPVPAIIVLQVATKFAGEDVYRRWMRGELGLVENLTVLWLLLALSATLYAFTQRRHVRSRLFGPAMAVMSLGLFFFAGEEASWGQHWFGFAPPEEIAQRNEQGEFNLHNDPLLESFLDQLPRFLLTLAALFGGVIAPLAFRSRVTAAPDFDSPSITGWMWPPITCVPAALVALTISLPKKIAEAAGQAEPYYLDIAPGETKEFCLALFLLVCSASLALHLRARSPRVDYGTS